MNGGMDTTGAFCEFYEEQVRYAFRLIADEKVRRLSSGTAGTRTCEQTFAMS